MEYSLANDAEGNAIAGAIRWGVELLTGSFGTSACVLAVAAFGALLLSGKVPVRRGLSVIVGCFIIFFASNIADGLTAYRPSGPSVRDAVSIHAISPVQAFASAPPAAGPYADPYGFPPANQ